MTKRILFIFLFLSFSVGVTFFTLKQAPKQEPVAQLIIPNNIDYYLSNTKQKSFNMNGAIDFILNSTLLEHFKREDQSRLIEPDIQVHRNTMWQIKAMKGLFFHPEEIITFNKNVLLDKHSEMAPFQVFSNDLLLNIQQDLVISKSSVKVIGDSWKLHAETMTLDIKNEVHQFTQVTAQYRYDKSS